MDLSISPSDLSLAHYRSEIGEMKWDDRHILKLGL